MNQTSFTLKDLFEVYHEKCRELDEIKRIKDLLVDQNERLIESNYESEKVKDLEYEIALLQVQLEDSKNENDHLKKSLARAAQKMMIPNIDSNRFFDPTPIQWDDYKTGG